MEIVSPPQTENRKSSWLKYATILVFLILAFTAVVLTSPPEPKGLGEPTELFSAQRAFLHTEKIAQNPHMTGSLEHDGVCSYIFDELERIGLQTQIQSTPFVSFDGYILYSNITNVIGRLPGADSSKAIMIVGHYDTQPHTPGAADDGIAVAAMLEAAETLKNHHKLNNDIIFLFTDAEEIGLIGAEAFAEEHPWMDDVGLILNLEARGNKGPAVAFEVSDQNGWIINEFIKGVERPFAASMMYEVYKMMPNNTDFTVFKDRGFSGFNVALVDGFANYHSATDTPENLSLASLQHIGSYVMSIAHHFGNISLNETKADDLVYFNIFGHKMISYPASWSIPIFVLVVILFITFTMLGLARLRLNFAGIGVSFLVTLLSIAFALGLVWVVNFLVTKAYPHYGVFYMSNFYNVHYYFYAFIALTFLVFTLVYSFYLKHVNIYNVMAAVFLLFILVSGFLLWFLPTASYLTIVPLLLGLLAFNIVLFFGINADNRPKTYHAIMFITLFPVIFLLSPYIYLIFVIFGLNLPIAGAGMLMLLLLFALPFLEKSAIKLRGAILFATLLLAVVFIIIAHVNSSPSNERPLQSNVMYASHQDNVEAYWLSSNHRVDEWNKQFFANAKIDSITDIYPGRQKLYLKNEAEFMHFEKPMVELLNDSSAVNYRFVEFVLTPQVDAVMTDILIPARYNLQSFAINNRDVNFNDYPSVNEQVHWVRLVNPSINPIKFSLEYSLNDSLNVSVVEKMLGLPDFQYIDTMPSHVIPDTDFESFMTLSISKFEL